MDALFQLAFFAAVGLWIPLGLIAALRPSVRRRVMVPLLASAIGAAFEAYISFVWSHTASIPMRVDVFLVLCALTFVDAIAGFSLVVGARGRPDRTPLLAAGALCLAVPALAIAGFAALRLDFARVDRNSDLARRVRFEAYFRDDDTEKRVFGALEPGKNPFAGYYAYAGKDDDRYAHLVINDEGRFWIYHSQLSVWQGTGGPATNGTFEGAGEGHMYTRMRMALRRQEGGPFLLEVSDGNLPQPTTSSPAPMRRADPPRFPRRPSASDEVRFAGVFSATYGEKDGAFWLIQVWLWESGGEWWGQYLHDRYTRGAEREFISTEKIVPVCSKECKVLSFTGSRGPLSLTRVTTGELTTTVGSPPEQVTLIRGETLPGFFLDLAPVATKAENRQWLEAVTSAGMITWRIPPVPPIVGKKPPPVH